jgi:hypothetical protein
MWCSKSNNCSILNFKNATTQRIYPFQTLTSFNLVLAEDFNTNCSSLLTSKSLIYQFLYNGIITQISATPETKYQYKISRDSLDVGYSYYFNLAWNYSSGYSERISNIIQLESLPYISIVQVLFIQSSGNNHTLKITTNQDLRRYERLRLKMYPDNLNWIVDKFDINGNSFNFETDLNLFDSQRQLILSHINDLGNFTLNPYKLILDISISPKVVEKSQNFTFNITGSLPSGNNYTLVNSTYGIVFNCYFNVSLLCNKHPNTEFLENILIVKLSLKLGNDSLSEFSILFYEKNAIKNVFPNQTLDNGGFNVSFETSTFKKSQQEIYFECKSGLFNFSAQLTDDKTITCLNVTLPDTGIYEFDILIKSEQFVSKIANQNSFKLTFFSKIISLNLENQKIYPSSSLVFINQTEKFQFSTEFIFPYNLSSLECKLENGKSFKAFHVSDTLKEFECEIFLENQQNISLWSNNFNYSLKISTNTLTLFYFEPLNISFAPGVKQIGYTSMNNSVKIELNKDVLPIRYQHRVACLLNNSQASSLFLLKNVFNCTLNSSFDGIGNVNMEFTPPNSYKISNISGIFIYRSKLRINSLMGTLNQNHTIQLKLNTKRLIENLEIRGDCRDIAVTYKNTSIGLNISQCNSEASIIEFNVQNSFKNSSDYYLYYGNEFYETPKIFSRNKTVVELFYENDEPVSVKISKTDLKFLFFSMFNINLLSLTAAMIDKPDTVNFLTSKPNVDYGNLLEYEVRDHYHVFNSNVSGTTFSSIVSSSVKEQVYFSIYAKYKLTNEVLEVSSKQIFYFWSLKSFH